MESVTLVTFAVDDTSPFVSYSPFGDTFSAPNVSAGWNPYFTISGYANSQGEVGNGTSQHITSHDGASLALQWHGTGITLMGNATQANYSIILDGQVLSEPNGSTSDNVLANVQNLNNALHTINLTAQIPEAEIPLTSMVVFDQAILFSSPIPVADSIGFQNQTLDDQKIAFLGGWSITPPGSPEFHSTNTMGDSAIANFNGTTLILLGQTSPSGGNYSVVLDNTTSTTLSARSSFTQNDSLLFYATDLDQTTTHSIVVQNLDGTELSLLIGGFKAIVASPISSTATNAATTMSSSTADPTQVSGSSTSFAEGTIAAFALAGILAFILISGALYFFCIYRPRRRRRQSRRRSRHSFYTGQKFMYDPSSQARASPKAQEAAVIGGVRGGGSQEDVMDIAPGFDKSVDPDLEDAGPSPVEIEEERRGPKRWSLVSDFQRWRRAAVRGSLGGISLGIHFRNSGSGENEKGISNSTQPTRTGNDTSANTNTNTTSANRTGFADSGRPASSLTSLPSSGSTARRERAKRKGKMRAVSGRSWSPSFMLDLPVWLGGRQNQSPTQAQRQSQRLSELRAQHQADAQYDTYTSIPHAYGRAGHAAGAAVEHPPSYAASVSLSNRDSNRDSHSDPSSFLVPSGPRSVSSNSPVFHGVDMHQQRRDSDNNVAAGARPSDSRHLSLNEAEESAGQDVPVSMALVSAPQNIQTQANPKDTVLSSNAPPRPLPTIAQHIRPKQQSQHIYGQISTEPTTRTTPGLSRKIIDPRLIESSLEATDDNPSIEEPRAMREVLRSLSPRTSRLLPIPPPPPRRSQAPQELIISPTSAAGKAPVRLQSPASDEATSPDSTTGVTRRLLPLVETAHESRWMDPGAVGGGRTVKALPRTPTSDDDDEGEHVMLHEGRFLDMPETSPFRVDFETKSTRTSIRPLPPTGRSNSDTQSHSNNSRAGGASSDESTSDPLYYTTAAESEYKPARNTFGASESGQAGGSRLSEFVQGTSGSHLPFRLPSISFTDPHRQSNAPDGNATSSPDGPSPVVSEGVVSFIDFTSSPEGSLRVPSEKSSSKKKAKRGRRRSLPVPPLIVDEPRSRWSNTTVATNTQGDSTGGEHGHSNESSGESQKPTSPLSEHRSTDSSTFPISVLVDIPPSSYHIMETQQPDNSQRSSAFTTSDNLHVHPALESIESPTESLPLSTSEIRFRHSDSEDSSGPRRPTRLDLEEHDQVSGVPADEYRPRPFDPNILVSRVLGMSSPTSSSSATVRPPLHPSQSNIALSSATNSLFPIPSRHDSSNDQLNTNRPGQS